MKPVRVITVDGPPASGKSTLARQLAVRLRLPFLSTGALYRAVAWEAIRRGWQAANPARIASLPRRLRVECRLDRAARLLVLVSGRDVTAALDDPAVARLTSSVVAGIPAVRAAVNSRSRRLAAIRGLVAEGRDCGSVIFPDATTKLYLTASVEVRAARAFRRLETTGPGVRRQSAAGVLRDLRRREREERNRPNAPLLATADAWILDSTGKTPRQSLDEALGLIGPA